MRAYLTYLVGEVELPLPPEAMHSLVQQIVYILLKWFVGAAGMLAAVIFTASMIPQMFEPGAIDLLLSKPVSRSAAFLAKFCGGCAFILLNASLFVVGLWLILGLRHGAWNARILLAIPVFLLAFAIYFSISAYVGVRWRNPILAIALSLVAWMTTFGVYQTWWWGQRVALDGERAEVVLATESGPIVARKNGEVVHWNAGEWQIIFGESQLDPGLAMQRNTGQMYPLLGPVISGTGDSARLVAVERTGIPPMFQSLGRIVTGRAAQEWQREPGPAAPNDTFALRTTHAGDVLLCTRTGIRQLQFAAGTGEVAATTTELVTLKDLGPPQAAWPEPVDAALDPQGDQAVVYTRGRLLRLERSATGAYAVVAEQTTASSEPALVSLSRDEVVLARADAHVERFTRSDLQPLTTGPRLPTAPKRMLATTAGDSFLVLDHARTLQRVFTGGRIEAADVRGQRQITAIGVGRDGRVLVADRFPRVTTYSPAGDVLATAERHTGFARAFLWVIHPVRTVLPKPDELDVLVKAAVGVDESQTQSRGDDLTREREYDDLWTPVWTSALFVVVMLAVSCWSIERP